jgi:hypothetical protein
MLLQSIPLSVFGLPLFVVLGCFGRAQNGSARRPVVILTMFFLERNDL